MTGKRRKNVHHVWLRVCRHHSFSLGKSPQNSSNSREEIFFVFCFLFLSMFFQSQHYRCFEPNNSSFLYGKMFNGQYFGHLMQRTDSLEKTLMLGKIEGGRRTGWQRMRWLDGTNYSKDMSLSKLRGLVMTGRPGVQQSVWSQRVRHGWATELNWSCLNRYRLLGLITKLCLTLLWPHELSTGRLLCLWHPPG